MFKTIVAYIKSVDPVILAAWIGALGAVIGGFIGAIIGGRFAIKSAKIAGEEQLKIQSVLLKRDRFIRASDLLHELFSEVTQALMAIKDLQIADEQHVDQLLLDTTTSILAEKRINCFKLLTKLSYEKLLTRTETFRVGEMWSNDCLFIVMNSQRYDQDCFEIGKTFIGEIDEEIKHVAQELQTVH